jgi:hypothetical protein
MGLQQPAMARRHLLSQVQRVLARFGRILQPASEQRTECPQSGGCGDRCRRRHAIRPEHHAVQRANPAALTCTASVQTFLTYVNYSPNRLNNFSLRLDAPAFNGNFNAGIAPNRSYGVIGAADLIIHF